METVAKNVVFLATEMNPVGFWWFLWVCRLADASY